MSHPHPHDRKVPKPDPEKHGHHRKSNPHHEHEQHSKERRHSTGAEGKEEHPTSDVLSSGYTGESSGRSRSRNEPHDHQHQVLVQQHPPGHEHQIQQPPGHEHLVQHHEHEHEHHEHDHEHHDDHHHEHQKWMLMYPNIGAGGVPGASQPPPPPQPTLARPNLPPHSNKERIEVIVHQPPAQQIQFPQQQPQPIIINTGEHNPFLSESNSGPLAKRKKRNSEAHEHEFKEVRVSQGTGPSDVNWAGNKSGDEQKSPTAATPSEILLQQKRARRKTSAEELEGLEEEAQNDFNQEVIHELKRQYGDHCPLCGDGELREEFTWTGWVFALLCFPCGVLLLYTSKAVTCSNCKQVFHL